MSHLFGINTNISLTPIVNGQRVAVSFGPDNLRNLGYNILMEISTASAYINPQSAILRKSITVMGHFDTGASVTSIDENLASHLGLISTGSCVNLTAAGPRTSHNFAVDVSFIGTTLRSIINLNVGSCNLGFNLANALTGPNDPRNMGLLIGRDIMSLWNITWHGPTSTVFISD